MGGVFRVPRQVLVYLFRRTASGDAEFLLLKRLPEHGGFWQGITGSPEGDENDEDAAIREVREETGLDIAGRLEALDFRYELHWHEDDPVRWERLYGPNVGAVPEEVYTAEVLNGWEPVLAPLEHEAFRWCTFDRALELLKWENNRRALVAARERLALD